MENNNLYWNPKEMLVTLLLIVFSTFEFFFREQNLLYVLFVIAIFISGTKITVSQKRAFYLIIPFLFCVSLQVLVKQTVNINGLLGDTLLLLGSLAVAVYLQDQFFVYFVKIVYAISIISLAFYLISYIPQARAYLVDVVAPHFQSLNVEHAINEGGGCNILIYNFLDKDPRTIGDGLLRNHGPFWECGMYAVFLCLALFFNNTITHISTTKYNIVFVISLLSTFSAGGYIASLIVLFTILTTNYSKSVFKYLLTLSILVAIAYFLTTFDFLGEKISMQLSDAEVGNDLSRFSAILTQLEMIKASPLIGGENINDYLTGETKTLASGIIAPIAQLGIPMSILFYTMLLKSCVSLYSVENKKWVGIMLFFLLLVLSISQTILISPLIFVLMFIGLRSDYDMI